MAVIITNAPLTIFDERTLDVMAQVEFPERPLNKNQTKEDLDALLTKLRLRWKQEQLDSSRRDAYEYSWLGAKQQYEHVRSVYSSEELPNLTSAIHVIYGVGGWHRYMVTADGRVHFSFHHATREAQERATRLGFPRW